MVARIVGAVLLTLVIFHVVAFAVYVPWSAVTGLQPTAGHSGRKHLRCHAPGLPPLPGGPFRAQRLHRALVFFNPQCA